MQKSKKMNLIVHIVYAEQKEREGSLWAAIKEAQPQNSERT